LGHVTTKADDNDAVPSLRDAEIFASDDEILLA
jgi:hypothetical protein